jgi:hypothetical protein
LFDNSLINLDFIFFDSFVVTLKGEYMKFFEILVISDNIIKVPND